MRSLIRTARPMARCLHNPSPLAGVMAPDALGSRPDDQPSRSLLPTDPGKGDRDYRCHRQASDRAGQVLRSASVAYRRLRVVHGQGRLPRGRLFMSSRLSRVPQPSSSKGEPERTSRLATMSPVCLRLRHPTHGSLRLGALSRHHSVAPACGTCSHTSTPRGPSPTGDRGSSPAVGMSGCGMPPPGGCGELPIVHTCPRRSARPDEPTEGSQEIRFRRPVSI